MALHETRVDLKKEPSHDWASLIAYVRFPENIDNQLQDAQLKVVFGSMTTTNKWVEHILKNLEKIPDDQKIKAFEEVRIRIDRSIDQLSSYLDESKTKSKLDTKE